MSAQLELLATIAPTAPATDDSAAPAAQKKGGTNKERVSKRRVYLCPEDTRRVDWDGIPSDPTECAAWIGDYAADLERERSYSRLGVLPGDKSTAQGILTERTITTGECADEYRARMGGNRKDRKRGKRSKQSRPGEAIAVFANPVKAYASLREWFAIPQVPRIVNNTPDGFLSAVSIGNRPLEPRRVDGSTLRKPRTRRERMHSLPSRYTGRCELHFGGSAGVHEIAHEALAIAHTTETAVDSAIGVSGLVRTTPHRIPTRRASTIAHGAIIGYPHVADTAELPANNLRDARESLATLRNWQPAEYPAVPCKVARQSGPTIRPIPPRVPLSSGLAEPLPIIDNPPAFCFPTPAAKLAAPDPAFNARRTGLPMNEEVSRECLSAYMRGGEWCYVYRKVKTGRINPRTGKPRREARAVRVKLSLDNARKILDKTGYTG